MSKRVPPPLLLLLGGAAIASFLIPGVGGQGPSWEGIVLHERPDLYEADGVTMKSGTGMKALRLLANRPESGAVGDAMGRLVPILKQVVGEINNSTTVLPDYVLELYLTDSMCSVEFAVRSSLRLIYSNDPGFFHMQFGPLCSGPVGAVNDMIQVFKLFQIATISRGAFLSDGARYPYLCRTSPSLQFVADGISKFIRVMGWTRVGAVSDTKSLSIGTVTEFKAAVRHAIAANYSFDETFVFANSFTIDGKNFDEADIVSTLRRRLVKVALIALYEDVGANFYCEVYRQQLFGKGLQTILALSWWGDSWIAEQKAERPDIPCTVGEIYEAAKHMFSMGQTAFLVSNTIRHEITGTILSDIKDKYFEACTADDAEGCHTDFASYDYDGLALLAKAFHVWLYDQGHSLGDIDYSNPEPQIQLYEIVKNMSFLGCTGQVEFFSETILDCERKGTFSLRQLLGLALNKGDQGWYGIVSFTNSDGFAEIVPWSPIVWQDGSESHMGSGTGWRETAPLKPASYGNDSYGLENVPIDWIQCNSGETSNGEACVPCPVGTRGEGGDCFECGSGKYNEVPGSRFCRDCPSGRFQNETGAQECKNCTAGFVTNQADLSTCRACPAGQYQPGHGQDACLFCGTGFFQEGVASTACQPCPVRRTTSILGAFLSEHCVCETGSFEPHPVDPTHPDKCEECPEAMTCEEGSRFANLLSGSGPRPLVDRGFMTLADKQLKAYECLKPTQCPGGEPASCAPLRDSTTVACGICEVGSYDDGSDCVACEGSSVLPMLLVGLLGLVLLFVLSFVINRDFLMQSHGSLACVIATGNLFAGIQTLSVFSQLSIDWFEPVATLLRLMTLLSFDMKVLKMGCLVGGDPVVKYALRQFVAPFCGVVILMILCGKKRFKPAVIVWVEFVNTCGTIFNLFFISIIISTFTPLVCYTHPGGHHHSMRASPSTLCFDDAGHSWMVIIGLIAFTIAPLPFFSAAIFCTVKYPSMTAKVGPSSAIFLQATRFFFFKFAPTRYYYGICMLLRSLLVCLVPVVVRDDTPLQVMVMCLIISTFLMVQTQCMPWRVPMNNFFDTAINLAMLLLMVIGSMAIGLTADEDSVQIVGTVAFAIVFLLAGASLAAGVCKFLRTTPYYSRFICHHKAHAAAQARLLKILLQSSTGQAVFVDSDDLVELDGLFDIVKTRVGHLVVYLTRNTLSRPWCAGEIATALATRSCKVVKVLTEAFVPPTEEQLSALDSYLDLKTCSLEQYGITIAHIQGAFQMLLSGEGVITIMSPSGIMCSPRFERLTRLLVQCKDDPVGFEHEELAALPALPSKKDMLVISSDVGDLEATAAVGILVSKIRRDLVSVVPSGVCTMCDYAEDDPEAAESLVSSAQAVVIALSVGTLMSTSQLTVAARAMQLYNENGFPAVIPMSLPGFAFPGEETFTRALPGVLHGGAGEVDVAGFVDSLRSFFKIISVALSTHASDQVLAAESQELLARIPRNRHGVVKMISSTKSTKGSTDLQDSVILAQSSNSRTNNKALIETTMSTGAVRAI